MAILYRCKYNIPIHALNKIFTQSSLCVNKELYYQRFKIICILLEVKSLKNDFIETRSAKLILLLYILKFIKTSWTLYLKLRTCKEIKECPRKSNKGRESIIIQIALQIARSQAKYLSSPYICRYDFLHVNNNRKQLNKK